MPSFMHKNTVVEYSLTRNAKKNVNFRIKANGEVSISAPKRITKAELDKMIFEKADWIIKNKEKMMAKNHNTIETKIANGSNIFIYGKTYTIRLVSGDVNFICMNDTFITIQIKELYLNSQKYINNYFEKWVKELIYEISNKFIDIYLIKLNKYNLKKPTLSIRNMTSRWGSCIPSKNAITINKKLIHYPFECLEYVVLHEISHLIEPNHSKNFYNIIESVMPDWKERKNVLNNF